MAEMRWWACHDTTGQRALLHCEKEPVRQTFTELLDPEQYKYYIYKTHLPLREPPVTPKNADRGGPE